MIIDWRKLERWSEEWERAKIFQPIRDPKRKKFFATFPFPYMNAPLHVGHGFTAARLDAYVRFKRMRGYNVLFPWAWHWTGEPIMGIALGVRRGDSDTIRVLREIEGVCEEDLRKFVDPIYVARYYTRESKKVVRRMGLSVDWSREFHTTSLNPGFSKFIEWQYQRLRKLGYVVVGTHPVVWCPPCQSPTGDHDRLEGVGVSPEEYILIKFKLDGAHLPAATFRPETIYGVTNLWINPDATYVEAQVGDETWIVSKECADKLREQLREVRIGRRFSGRELIGKTCREPLFGRELLILPAWFVDPDSGSGVVYSVPAHAPYDWVGLRDLLRSPDLLKEFGISAEAIGQIKPISMIQLEGFGDCPAIEIVEKMAVRDQRDPKVEEATKIIYKREFHLGVLKEVCGEYAGRRVSEVKRELVDSFVERGIADVMYDLVQPVICRCKTKCIVKVLKDQWFLAYSREDWKDAVREVLERAYVTPEEARSWFLNVISWLRDKACARRTGLGTPLPWDKKWIVETLSDSTVYMAYYIVSKFINEGKVQPEHLTSEVLDYVFLGEGDPDDISKEVGLNASVLREMREDFLYWYPVDVRTSAKELLPNHLTFFLFHHIALFPPELWPRGIDVNGVLMIEGAKMSKSKGNIITLRDAIDEYGPDAVRCVLILAAERMDDPDWRGENARSVKQRLEGFYSLARELMSVRGGKVGRLERWLTSMLQLRIEAITGALEERRTKTALEEGLFNVWNDVKWYLRRSEEPSEFALRELLSTWIRLLAPFAPFICEHIWHEMGNANFISTAPWPAFDESKLDAEAIEAEELVKRVVEDVKSILDVIRIEPRRICLYAAADWKWDIYRKALEFGVRSYVGLRDLMGTLEKRTKETAEVAKKIVEEVNDLSPMHREFRAKVGVLDELAVLGDAKGFLEREFRARIEIYSEDDPTRYDPANRAGRAIPYKPAIYVE